MREGQFNFNNEVDAFRIQIDEETGHVTVPGDDGPLAEYDSVQQMAELYAQARDVKPENLKNWTLLENGDVYSFVLRAGTAGVDVSEVEDHLEQIFHDLEGSFHALSIARAKEQIMSDGSVDLIEALVHCTETQIAKQVYDEIQAALREEDPQTEVAMPEEDNRSELEKYLDEAEERPGMLNLLAFIAGLPVDTGKDELHAALQNNHALSNVSTLNTICSNAINDTINDGIGVNCELDAIMVITQIPVGTKDDEMKSRMVNTARMARRDKVNISVDIVGKTHIRHTANLINVSQLDDVDLFVRDNVPYVVHFDEAIDAELEAERVAAEAAKDDEYDEYDDEYDDEYEDEE